MELKLKKSYQWLREKQLIMLFPKGTSISNGGLFKGAWSPHSGGGFGGSGIPETTYSKVICTGDVIEARISEMVANNSAPACIGFAHAPGGMRQWSLKEIMEADDV